jgi:hypothetical protein
MSKYWAFWKRGWWACLLMLCANVSYAFFIIPLAFAFHDNRRIYWVAAIAGWLVFVAPLWGWMFERFAAGSSRIVQSKDDLASAA